MRGTSMVAALLMAVVLAGCISGEDESMNGMQYEFSVVVVEYRDPGWPALEDAVVRPGVRVTSDLGGCTSNFVFRSPDNATLYLGLAAHCLLGEEANETVTIAGEVEGVVVYNAWLTMDELEGPGVSRGGNDFAVIELPDEVRGVVHPALVHFGGPVGIAERGVPGEKIFTYGTSSYRQGIYEINPREGYVWGSTATYTTMHIITPGVWGDSGSVVLNSKGEALGVLVHLGPAPATNGATNLHAALEFAKEHADLELELATWEMLEWGVLPEQMALL
jgi:hypothetical protein